jgi:hypothetical protein
VTDHFTGGMISNRIAPQKQCLLWVANIYVFPFN